MGTVISQCISCFLLMVTMVTAYVEVPKFSQLLLLYPGYHHYGGTANAHYLTEMIGGEHTNPIRYLHNTSPLRMSVALNRYGGRHAIGMEPIVMDDQGIVSVMGRDKQQYIFENTAFGPFLARKYGNPSVNRPNKKNAYLTMEPFLTKQGIVRFVTYHGNHAGGHIGLWDCDHLVQAPDWTTEHHMISVEFWETPDSYCITKPKEPSLQEILRNYRLVPRYPVSPQHQDTSLIQDALEDATKHKQRHRRPLVKRHRLKV